MHCNKLIGGLAACLVVVLAGCRGDGGTEGLPRHFDQKSDAEKMAYMMKEVTPDSVARFAIDASLGRIPGGKIDTLSTANLYALEHYRGENSDVYIQEFEHYKATKPLVDRMRLEKWMGNYDDTALGYQLGLEYVGYIREHNLSVKDVEIEITQLHRQADQQMYDRFMTGFRVALENDRGKDLSDDIYRRFSR